MNKAEAKIKILDKALTKYSDCFICQAIIRARFEERSKDWWDHIDEGLDEVHEEEKH